MCSRNRLNVSQSLLENLPTSLVYICSLIAYKNDDGTFEVLKSRQKGNGTFSEIEFLELLEMEKFFDVETPMSLTT